MEIKPIKTRIIRPPKDDLCEAIKQSDLSVQDGDCVAVTSKVVSIWEGRCIRTEDVTDRDELVKREAELYLDRDLVPGKFTIHTIKNNMLMSSAGLDASNADGHYVLWPEDPKDSANRLLEWLVREYNVKNLTLIITDSRSMFLRRGAIGFALAWAGFDPLYDHRGKKDLFGRTFNVEHTNIADGLAAAAVLAMGETNECTPLAVISDAPYLSEVKGSEGYGHDYSYEIPMEQDIYAPFLKNMPWKKGGKKKR